MLYSVACRTRLRYVDPTPCAIKEERSLLISDKLIWLSQTNSSAEMMAVLYVLKVVLTWTPIQMCTDSQLVVDTLLYWME